MTKQEIVNILKDVVKELECKDEVAGVLGSTRRFEWGRSYSFPSSDLVRNIHIGDNTGVEFTHSNDLDVVKKLNYSDFILDSGWDKWISPDKLHNEFKKLNLADEINVYNGEIIYNQIVGNTVSSASQELFWRSLQVLITKMGYKTELNDIGTWHGHIIKLKKECS